MNFGAKDFAKIGKFYVAVLKSQYCIMLLICFPSFRTFPVMRAF